MYTERLNFKYAQNHHFNALSYIKSHDSSLFLHIILLLHKLFNRNCIMSAQKCCGECVEGNLAHLQAHEVSEACKSRTSSNAPEEISVGNLCVSTENPIHTIAKFFRNPPKILNILFLAFNAPAYER